MQSRELVFAGVWGSVCNALVGQLCCAPVLVGDSQHCSCLCMNCLPHRTELETPSCERNEDAEDDLDDMVMMMMMMMMLGT